MKYDELKEGMTLAVTAEVVGGCLDIGEHVVVAAERAGDGKLIFWVPCRDGRENRHYLGGHIDVEQELVGFAPVNRGGSVDA